MSLERYLTKMTIKMAAKCSSLQLNYLKKSRFKSSPQAYMQNITFIKLSVTNWLGMVDDWAVHKYCINITQISTKYHPNITENHPNITQILPKYHPNIAQIFPKYHPKNTQTVPQLLTDIKISPKYCPNITQISPKYRPNITQISPEKSSNI